MSDKYSGVGAEAAIVLFVTITAAVGIIAVLYGVIVLTAHLTQVLS